MSESVEGIRYEWKQALDSDPLDLEQLRQIHARYHAQRRRDATWRKVYEKARAEWIAERQELTRQLQSELQPLTKDQLFVRAGIWLGAPYKRAQYTKKDLIGWIVDRACDTIEGETVRARRQWQAMTDEERQGISAS